MLSFRSRESKKRSSKHIWYHKRSIEGKTRKRL